MNALWKVSGSPTIHYRQQSADHSFYLCAFAQPETATPLFSALFPLFGRAGVLQTP
jgi:hypothetical protein